MKNCVIIITFQKFYCKIEKQDIAKVKKRRNDNFMEHFLECERWVRYDSCPYFWSIAHCGKTEHTLSISGELCARSPCENLTSAPSHHHQDAGGSARSSEWCALMQNRERWTRWSHQPFYFTLLGLGSIIVHIYIYCKRWALERQSPMLCRVNGIFPTDATRRCK